MMAPGCGERTGERSNSRAGTHAAVDTAQDAADASAEFLVGVPGVVVELRQREHKLRDVAGIAHASLHLENSSASALHRYVEPARALRLPLSPPAPTDAGADAVG